MVLDIESHSNICKETQPRNMKNYLVFWSLFISVIASKSEPDIKGLSREPENGLVQLGQTMKCLLNGQKPEDLQWFTISKEGEKNSIEESDVKATKEDVTYRCEVDDENYAEFKVDKDQLQPGLEFRVEPFGKSLYVVEQEDLKIECVIVKQNASELDIAKEVEIKWYEYEEQGDDTTYLPTLGNCSGILVVLKVLKFNTWRHVIEGEGVDS